MSTNDLPPALASMLDNAEKEMDIKQKIVEELLNDKTNLETKTELSKPIRWSCMSMIQELLENKNLQDSSTILKRFTNTAFRYLISKERKGRNEYIEALKSISRMDTITPNVKNIMER